MEEIRLIGSRMKCSTLKAIQFPEKNFINDLLFHYKDMCEVVSAGEYEGLRKKIEQV